MLESRFEKRTIDRIQRDYPGAVILKNYPGYRQGFPDRLILFQSTWAALEFKDGLESPHEPNQDYYVELLNRMSYASFIYPENERRVMHELQQAFGA